jgi:histone H4
MVNERPKQFGGLNRFGGISSPGIGRPPSSATVSAASPSQSRAQQLGLGLGKGSCGLGKGKGEGLKRHMFVFETWRRALTDDLHRKIQRDTIYGVTKGDIR